MVLVPFIRYYVSTPGINACVLEYVDEIENGDTKGYIYDIHGVRHIEPSDSIMIKSLEQYKIWEANGCLMSSDNLFSDLNNTFYCAVTYLIKKAPVRDELKEPLQILKSE